jgi:hypothetical protein
MTWFKQTDRPMRQRCIAGFLVATLAGLIGAGLAQEQEQTACLLAAGTPVYVLPEVEVVGKGMATD